MVTCQKRTAKTARENWTVQTSCACSWSSMRCCGKGALPRPPPVLVCKVRRSAACWGNCATCMVTRFFVRTAKGLVPTPLAEGLRLRLRALAAETEQLILAPLAMPVSGAPAVADGWTRSPLIAAPPLAVRRSALLQGEPPPEAFARKLARIGHNAEPQKRLAKYIATAGNGIGRSRPLMVEEAEDALAIVLGGRSRSGTGRRASGHLAIPGCERCGDGGLRESLAPPCRCLCAIRWPGRSGTGRPIFRQGSEARRGSCMRQDWSPRPDTGSSCTVILVMDPMPASSNWQPKPPAFRFAHR